MPSPYKPDLSDLPDVDPRPFTFDKNDWFLKHRYRRDTTSRTTKPPHRTKPERIQHWLDWMKLLHFADGGFWLYYRLLESGTFEVLSSPPDSAKLQIDATELSMLLSGVSLAASSNRRKRCAG